MSLGCNSSNTVCFYTPEETVLESFCPVEWPMLHARTALASSLCNDRVDLLKHER